MSAVTASESFITSLSPVSAASSDFEDPDICKIKNQVKEILKSRIFLGRYIERRLADKRIGYRDIVLISAAETELKRDLLDALLKLRSIAPSSHWIGISESELLGYSPGVCIWTEIDNQPFGACWFQIRSLKFRDQEIIVSVKCLRHISEAFLEIEPILTGAAKKVNDSTDKKLESSVGSLNETCTDIIGTLKGFVSISNVKDFVTFCVAFVIALITGSNSFVNLLGNFILALIRETSILIKNSTPMFLGLLDFCSKIIGGFYILLAMMFKQSAPPPSDKRSVAYQDRSRRSQVNYQYDGHFD